jgi:hypothetical protein
MEGLVVTLQKLRGRDHAVVDGLLEPVHERPSVGLVRVTLPLGTRLVLAREAVAPRRASPQVFETEPGDAEALSRPSGPCDRA